MEDAAITQSEMEEAFKRICDRHRIPRPQTQYRLGAKTYDFAWPELRLIVETDSWLAHGTPYAFQADRSTSNQLQLNGWMILRFTWKDVTKRSRRVATAVKEALKGRSASSDPPRRPPRPRPATAASRRRPPTAAPSRGHGTGSGPHRDREAITRHHVDHLAVTIARRQPHLRRARRGRTRSRRSSGARRPSRPRHPRARSARSCRARWRSPPSEPARRGGSRGGGGPPEWPGPTTRPQGGTCGGGAGGGGPLAPLPRRQLQRRRGEVLVVDQRQQVRDAVQPRAALVVGVHHVPRRDLDVGVAEHLVLGARVVDPAGARLEVHRAQLPAAHRIVHRAWKRRSCSSSLTENQYLISMIPERRSIRSNSGQERMNSSYSRSVQNPITRSTPARLYQERSKRTISPAAGGAARSAGSTTASSRARSAPRARRHGRPVGFVRSAMRLITPPLPAASRPSKITTILRPFALTYSPHHHPAAYAGTATAASTFSDGVATSASTRPIPAMTAVARNPRA